MSFAEDKPFFSVVIPVFNRVEPLRRALASVLEQNFQSFEVLVVDDGSAPEIAIEIAALVSGLQDNRFKLIAYPENRNGAYARNQGIAAAAGCYICFLDSDDEWLPAKLSEGKTFLEQNSDCKLFYHRYSNVRRNIPEPALPQVPIRAGQSAAEYSFCTNRYGGIQSSCITAEAEHAKAVRFNDRLKGHQDWDFVIRATHTIDEIGFIPEVLTHRHIAEGNIGMVSRNLNYQFSREFLSAYRQYFSLKATAAYATYILTHKRLKAYPKPAFDCYQLLAWLYNPFHCYQQYRQLRQLKARCEHLLDYCQRQNIRHLALSGYNDYTEFFLGSSSEYYDSILLLDKSKILKTTYGQVVAANKVEPAQWERVQLAVLMTDLHAVSMKQDLMKYITPEKIIEF